MTSQNLADGVQGYRYSDMDTESVGFEKPINGLRPTKPNTELSGLL